MNFAFKFQISSQTVREVNQYTLHPLIHLRSRAIKILNTDLVLCCRWKDRSAHAVLTAAAILPPFVLRSKLTLPPLPNSHLHVRMSQHRSHYGYKSRSDNRTMTTKQNHRDNTLSQHANGTWNHTQDMDRGSHKGRRSDACDENPPTHCS